MQADTSNGKTVVVMVTIGPDARSRTRKYSVPRAQAYAQRHGYDFVRITERIAPDADRTPHWEKLLVHRVLPDYARWLVVDDDVLINVRLAPPLPELRPGCIGMVKEPVPTHFEPPMDWLGNSGVLLFDRAALDLIEATYEMGEYKEIVPGYGDQPALNAVAWRAGRVERLEWKWNYMLVADWLLQAHRQTYPWTKNVALARWARVTLYARLWWARIFPASTGPLAQLRECYFVHLIWFRMAVGRIDAYLGGHAG